MECVKEDIEKEKRFINHVLITMQGRYNFIQNRKSKDQAVILIGIAKQVKEAVNTATDINRLCRITATLYKEFATLLPFYDYAYEWDFVLAYVEKYGLDLEVLEALQRKNFKKIQEIISNA